MLINSAQLDTNLDNQHNLYLLFGAEELLIQQSSDTILQTLKNKGFINKFIFDIDARFNFTELNNELVARDLFASKKIMQINILSNSAKITTELSAIAANIKEDVVVVIIMKKLTPAQQKAKWFMSIKNLGLVVQHFEVYPNQMKSWVITQMQKLGLATNHQIAQIIADNNESNLLSANNELQKLKFVYCNKVIDTEEFIKQTTQQSVYSVYSLIDNALLGHTTKVYQIYQQITIDTNHLTSLLYIQLKQLINIHLKIKQQLDLGSALKEVGVWSNKTNIITTALKQHTYPKLQKLLLTLGRIDRANKGRDDLNIKQSLLQILLTLAGKHNGLNH